MAVGDTAKKAPSTAKKSTPGKAAPARAASTRAKKTSGPAKAAAPSRPAPPRAAPPKLAPPVPPVADEPPPEPVADEVPAVAEPIVAEPTLVPSPAARATPPPSVARADRSRYEVEVSKRRASPVELTDALNQRWATGWQLAHVVEQRGSMVLFFEKRD